MTLRLGLPATSLAAAFVGIQVGASMVASRFVLGPLGPAELAFYRYGVAFLLLLPLLLRRGIAGLTLREFGAVVVLGCVQFALLMICVNRSLGLIPAGTSALVFALMPLVSLILAASLGRERLTWPKALGVGVSIVGVGLALGRGVAFAGTTEAWLGVLWSFGAATCGAVCSVLVGPLVGRRGALPVGCLAMAAAGVALLLPAIGEGFLGAGRSGLLPPLDAGAWLLVVFIGASSALGFLLWVWALGRVSPTQVTVFLALAPVTAILLGAWLLAEPLGLAQLGGVACVALGLWLAYRPDPAPAAGQA